MTFPTQLSDNLIITRGYIRDELKYLLLILLFSCSTLSFQSEGKIPIFMSSQKAHHIPLKIEGKKEFYLWGIIGPDTKIYMDKLLKNEGYAMASNLRVEQYQSFTNWMYSIFSFGLYTPVNFRISGFGVTPDNEKRVLKRNFNL